MTVTPAAAGTFDAICDDYCGSGHGNMKMQSARNLGVGGRAGHPDSSPSSRLGMTAVTT